MENDFYVEIITQHGSPECAPLPTGRVVAGRSPRTCQLILPDPRVSRVHLQIRHEPFRGITVTDLFSANGTQVGGYVLMPGTPIHWLTDQIICIGSTRIVLRYGCPPQASTS
jgi:pSer/pThr/pTyr-binding forkhead associated (FHA) protein